MRYLAAISTFGCIALSMCICEQSRVAGAEPPREDRTFFTGKDLSGWKSTEMKYWSVDKGTIVGKSAEKIPRNEFLWSTVKVSDFYLAVDVKLAPDDRNAGIQFRSTKINAHGQAKGYQADIGRGVWGRLYHEHGRGKLDWTASGEKAVKVGGWNHYEILAVGHRVWTAINGTLSVAIEDPSGELSGHIALQIHAGPSQTVQYRIRKLIHHPKIALAGLDETHLKAAIRGGKKPTSAARQMSALVRPLKRNDKPMPLVKDTFSVDRDQTIVVLGSTNAVSSQRHGYIETLMAAAYPQCHLRFRNMAWQADTVFRQQRPRHFYLAGPLPNGYRGENDQRKPIRADTIILWMGQSESLDGLARRDAFRQRYSDVVRMFGDYARQIVLVTPVPFENPQGLPHDVNKRNKTLKAYATAIKEIAITERLPVIDLFGGLSDRKNQSSITTNGMHLNEHGHWLVARAFAKQLAFAEKVRGIELRSPAATIHPVDVESLRELVVARNRLWFRYWRPTNWAFLYGNRQEQPSSRDHRDGDHRWFPEEIESAESLLMSAVCSGKTPAPRSSLR